MQKIKKIFILCLLLFFALPQVYADSNTFDLRISGISGGLSGFGFGLFPLGTSWSYNTSFTLIPQLPRKTNLDILMGFSLSNGSMSSYYAWDNGEPVWNKYQSDMDWTRFISRTFFNPKAYMLFFLSQGFGDNKLSSSEPMLNLQFSFGTRYSMALERIDIIPNSEDLVFVDSKGNPTPPFGPNTVIPGYPWLQDSRMLLNNYVGIDLSFNHRRVTGFRTMDGLFSNIYFEMGPDWLLNSLLLSGTTSDYYKVGASLTECLTLLNIRQNNGMNWISIELSHNNSFDYLWGPVIPEAKIPYDRLQGSLSDTIKLSFTGPQFIAWDTYADLTLSLNNTLFFGHVVNEQSQTTKAIELKSSIDGFFHFRLFGFLNFGWNFGYDFAQGIWAFDPSWYQSAEVYFYVST